LDWPLCSAKLKSIIDTGASPIDHIQWLSAKVISVDGAEREYFILHLPKRVDAIDRQKSIYSGDFVVRPYFNTLAIDDHQVFSFPGGEFSVIVSEKVKNEILANGCIGIGFSKIKDIVQINERPGKESGCHSIFLPSSLITEWMRPSSRAGQACTKGKAVPVATNG
jgi:hypothetical protein